MTRISRRKALLGGLLLAGSNLPVAARATTQANATTQYTLPLWPTGAPGGERVTVAAWPNLLLDWLSRQPGFLPGPRA